MNGQPVRLRIERLRPRPLPLIVCVFVIFTISISNASCQSPTINQNNTSATKDAINEKKLELLDGVFVKFPCHDNITGPVMSFEVDTHRSLTETGRGKKNSQMSLMQRILPLFIMPFLIQSSIVPFFLSTLKFMLFKSMMVGKIALALIIFNAFRNQNTNKGRDTEMANIHYGYQGNGMEEYGAYINN